MTPEGTDRGTLWLRWLGANAFGEMLGLGLTFAVVALLFSGMGDQAGTTAVLASFLIAAASGAFLIRADVCPASVRAMKSLSEDRICSRSRGPKIRCGRSEQVARLASLACWSAR